MQETRTFFSARFEDAEAPAVVVTGASDNLGFSSECRLRTSQALSFGSAPSDRVFS